MAYESTRERLHPDFEGTNDAFTSFADGITPKTREEAFEWAEFLWYRLGTYRQAIHKVVSYFMTEADVTGASRERNDEWRELLNDEMDMLNVLKAIGIDYLQYGNSFSSIVFPIRRYLVCPENDGGCGLRARVERISYEWREGEYVAECKKCGYEGAMVVDDRKNYNSDDIHVLRWNPHAIDIEYSEATGDETLYWTPEQSWVESVQQGNRTVLNNAPMPMIEAAFEGKQLKLDPNLTHHLKYHHLAGIDTGGWGIPPVMSSFGDVYYLQLLRRFQEGVGKDFLFPIRLLTPAAPNAEPGSGQDPLRNAGNMGMPMMQQKLMELVQEAERNPGSYHAVPFPVQEGTISGQGIKMLQPKLMEHASGELLNSLGVPVEFYRGNMKWRSDPQAIRLMEKDWEHLTSALDSWLGWACDIIAMARSWNKVDVHLKPPSMFDDPVRRQILLQLAAQGEVSKKTALRPWNIDLEQERHNLAEERREEKEQMEEMEADEMSSLPNLVQAAQAGGMPGGGGPGGPAPGPGGGGPGGPPAPGGAMGMPPTMGGNAPMTVSNLTDKAEQIAQQLLPMPHPQRRQALQQIKQDSEALHAMVTDKMEEAREKVDDKGAMMARQQAFGAV